MPRALAPEAQFILDDDPPPRHARPVAVCQVCRDEITSRSSYHVDAHGARHMRCEVSADKGTRKAARW